MKRLDTSCARGSARMEAKFADVQTSIKHQNRNLFISMLTLQFTAFVLFMAAAHLT